MQNSKYKKPSKICVIIPAYNAGQTIAKVVAGALRHVSLVIVVDDGSTDNTAVRAAEAGAEVIVVETNQGKGNALKVLFETAIKKGIDAAISIDADCQHDTEDIPRFIRAHENYPHDLISGSRTLTSENMPRARYNAMQIARFFISLASNQLIDDSQCGFRLYPMELIEKVRLITEGYTTEAEILIKAGDIGLRIRSVTIRAIYNNYISHFKAVSDGIAIGMYLGYYLIIKWIIECFTSNRPFTYFPGRLHDFFGRNRFTQVLSSVFASVTILPSSLFFLFGYLFLNPIIKNNFASIRALNVHFFVITRAIHVAPLLMVLSIADKVLNAVGLKVRLVDRFIEVFYPYLWKE